MTWWNICNLYKSWILMTHAPHGISQRHIIWIVQVLIKKFQPLCLLKNIKTNLIHNVLSFLCVTGFNLLIFYLGFLFSVYAHERCWSIIYFFVISLSMLELVLCWPYKMSGKSSILLKNLCYIGIIS